MVDRYVCIKPSGYTLDGSESALYSAEYTSMSGAEAGENGAFTDDLYIDIIHGDATFNWDGTDDTTAVLWDGWDCTAGAKVIVRTLTAAQSANGVASRPDFSGGTRDTSEYLLYVNDDRVIELDNDYAVDKFLEIEFLGIQVESHTTNGSNFFVNVSARHTAITIDKCWIKNTSGGHGIYFADASAQMNITNCVVDMNGDGFMCVRCVGAGNVSVTNGTFFGAAFGIDESSSGTYKLINNIFADNANDFDGSFTGTQNASDDADGPGTNISPVGGADDWTGEIDTPFTILKPLDSGNIYHAGEVQNNDSDIPSDDIAGNARPTGSNAPTIGAFEFVSGSTQLPINEISQGQSIDNIDLIQQHILSINPINQAQSIDNIILQAGITLSINDIDQGQTIENIDIIQANVLSINELNQNQTLDNITLSLSVLLQIADIAQSQNIDIINLIQQNILSINGIDQGQTIENIDLIQANLLSIDPIDQQQTLDNIVLETGVLLQIAGIAQSQIIDNIDLIQQNILSILDIDQSQAIDNIDLTQANILAIADMTQQQIIDNIVLSITRIEGKISLTFVLTSPGISKILTIPGANFTGE